MIEHANDEAASEVDARLAELTEEITRRIEAGDTVTGNDLGDDPDHIGTIRQLLPTLRTIVAFGDQVVREQSSRPRLLKKPKENL